MTVQGPDDPGPVRPPGEVPAHGGHDAVGAYALGVLGAAEATAFEEHLVDCERCAGFLEELVDMGPLLARLAALPDPAAPGTAAPGLAAPGEVAPDSATRDEADPDRATRDRATRDRAAELAARPAPGLADRLLVDVAAHRARRRRRARYLVGAAAALVIAGPVTTLAVQGPGAVSAPRAGTGSAALRQMDEQVHATDAVTKVSATIGLEHTPWGTDTVLELKNVKGPLKCHLVAVGTDGSRETMSSWSVSRWGYGIPDSTWPGAEHPLYVHGSAAFRRDRIDHFEVRTSDGKRLVTVDAKGGSKG